MLDPDAARALDAAAMERFAMPGLLLMEHAAIGVAAVAEHERRLRDLHGVLVVCGPGGNGGDGWAVARLLANRGTPIVVAPLGSAPPGSDAGINEAIGRRMIDAGLEILDIDDDAAAADLGRIASDHLVVDGLFGIGLTRPLEGLAARVVDAISEAEVPIVAIDLPSGLDARTGRPFGLCVRAAVTATMVAPKTGMLAVGADAWTGRIEIVDIGTPPSLLREFGHVAGSAPVGDDGATRPADSPS